MSGNRIAGFLHAIRAGSRAHGVPFPAALARSLALYATGSFSRKEIAGYALYAPAVRASLPVLISKERSLAKLAAFNPRSHQHLTEAKDDFHRVCVREGIAVPATYGWTRGGVPHDAEGRPLGDAAAWGAHLARHAAADFIVKDRDGAYGSGFRAFRREGDAFVGVEDGTRLDAAGLGDALSGERGSDLIVQERLFDHPSLTAFCGRRGLQTVRINTLLGEDGGVTILFWMMKILAGHTLSDNFSMGTTGNLIAVGDGREDGVLAAAVTMHPSGSGLMRIGAHPSTGAAFAGFRLPFWREAVDLVTAAQRRFPQLRTLGWDVALTGRGPVVIEANARWDPPCYAPQIMSEGWWRAIFGNGDPAAGVRAAG